MISFVQSLNWVDYVILGIIAFSIIISFFRGFTREAISLAVWIIGVLLAFKFADLLQAYLEGWITSPSLRYVVAFALIFFIVFLFGVCINVTIHAIISKAGLSLTDRFLGILFGIARGVLIVAVLLMFVSVGKIKEGSDLSQSALAPKFSPIVVWLRSFLPGEVKHFSQWISGDDDEENS